VFLNFVGRLIGLTVAFFLLRSGARDWVRGKRRRKFGDTDPVPYPEFGFFWQISVDALVCFSLLWLNIKGRGFFFGKTVAILFGYLFFNLGVNESEEEKISECLVLYFIGIVVILVGIFVDFTFFELLEMLFDD